LSPATETATSRSGGPERFVVTLSFGGNANRREGISKLLQRSDASGGLDLNSGGTVVLSFDSTARRDEDFYEPFDSGHTAMRILKSGTYRCSFSAVAQNDGSADASVIVFVRKNGSGSGLVGSIAAIATTPTAPVGCASSTFLATLTNGDYLELCATRAGSSTAALSTYPSGVAFELELVSMFNESVLSGRYVFDRAASLQKATLIKGVSGFSGTTFVRILKNGATIMGSNDLSIDSVDTFAEFSPVFFNDVTFEVGDLLTADVVTSESPPSRDLKVICRFAAVNG